MVVRVKDFDVSGNLTEDPQQTQTRQGEPITVFTLAQNERYMDRESGQWRDGETNYFDVGIKNERLGNNVAASLRKGDHVNVNGTLQQSAYEHNGKVGMNTLVFANDVSPSLRYHTASPQADAGSSSQNAAAETNADAQAGASRAGAPSEADVVNSWATASPGAGMTP